MAMNVGSIFVELGAKFDNRGFDQFDRSVKSSSQSALRSERSMKGAARATDDMGRAAQRGHRSVGMFAGGLTRMASAVGGIYGVGAAMKYMIDQAGEAQAVAADTAQTIKTTGGVANVTAEEINNLSNALSRKTGFDDEAIQSGANLLLTFTNIRNEVGKGNDIFNQASMSALDMSRKFNQDLKSSAIQVGKALNDPIKGITALSRIGVSFTAQQKEQITALAETGHTLEAQKLILAELHKETGGAAEAWGKTLPGQLAKFKNALANVAEVLGAKLAPYVEKGAKALAKFADEFEKGTGQGGEFRRFLAQLWPALQQAIKAVADLAKTVGPLLIPVLKVAAGLLLAISKIFAALPGPVKQAVVAFVAFGVATRALHIGSLIGGLRTLIGVLRGVRVATILALGPWGILAALAIGAAVLILTHWKEFKAGLAKIWNWLKSAASNVFGFILKWVKTAFLGPLKLITKGWSIIIGLFNKLPGFITKPLKNVFKAITGFFGGAFDWVKDKVTDMANFVIDKLGIIGDAFKAAGGFIGKAWDKVTSFLGIGGGGGGDDKKKPRGKKKSSSSTPDYSEADYSNLDFSDITGTPSGKSGGKSGGKGGRKRSGGGRKRSGGGGGSSYGDDPLSTGDYIGDGQYHLGGALGKAKRIVESLDNKEERMGQDYDLARRKFEASGDGIDSGEYQQLIAMKREMLAAKEKQLKLVRSSMPKINREVAAVTKAIRATVARANKTRGKGREALRKRAEQLAKKLEALKSLREDFLDRAKQLGYDVKEGAVDLMELTKEAGQAGAGGAGGGSSTSLADQFASFNSARFDLMTQYGGNTAALSASMAQDQKAGEKKLPPVIINQTYTQAPSDPGAWTKSVELQIKAAA